MNFRLRRRVVHRSPLATLGGIVLILGGLALLWIQIGFGQYAFTFGRWMSAEGTVVSEGSTSDPTIEFQTPDGATHRFSEDYILLCGSRRDLCFIRHFAQGQVVPVTYDRVFPQRAYVRDWALIANVITFFIELGLTLMFILMLVVILTPPDIPVGSGTEGDSYPPM